MAVLPQLREHSDLRSDYLITKCQWLDRFKPFLFPLATIQGMANDLQQVSLKCCHDDPSVMIVWIALPFHPILEKPFQDAITIINGDVALNALFQQTFNKRPRLRISWRNALPSLKSRLQAIEFSPQSTLPERRMEEG